MLRLVGFLAGMPRLGGFLAGTQRLVGFLADIPQLGGFLADMPLLEEFLADMRRGDWRMHLHTDLWLLTPLQLVLSQAVELLLLEDQMQLKH